ncbi:hypothetical protein, partial [Arthrobacter sp. DR-2P]
GTIRPTPPRCVHRIPHRHRHGPGHSDHIRCPIHPDPHLLKDGQETGRLDGLIHDADLEATRPHLARQQPI